MNRPLSLRRMKAVVVMLPMHRGRVSGCTWMSKPPSLRWRTTAVTLVEPRVRRRAAGPLRSTPTLYCTPAHHSAHFISEDGRTFRLCREARARLECTSRDWTQKGPLRSNFTLYCTPAHHSDYLSIVFQKVINARLPISQP